MKKFSGILACTMAALMFLSSTPALTITGAAETASAADTAADRTYKVTSGDTLWKIADEIYGDSGKWELIYEANKDKLRSPGAIMPGQVLVLPASEGADTVEAEAAEAPATEKEAEKKPAAEAPAAEKEAEEKPAAEAPATEKEAEEKPAAEAETAETAATETAAAETTAAEAETAEAASAEASPAAETGSAALTTYWTQDSKPAQELRDYVAKVTDPADKENFIPEKDRIAVFDMDGTLVCETYYTYYDTMMFIEYCLHDPPERVSDELKDVAAAIKPGYVADETLARNFAKAYAGMTVEEFYDYVVEFGKKKTASFNNMRYIDNFYLPMVELVKYLYENDFTIYVISGTERTTTRAIIANSPIKDYVTPNHVIGTDFEIKKKGFENEPANINYKYENGDELVLTGGFIQKNLNGNKTIYIEREIGQRPVLAFGNSGSDTSMMNYAIDSRNPYPAQAYMVVADDDVREWGKQNWEEKSADYESKGYIPISMKNDFARIYPDDITKADQQYVPAETEEDEALDPAA